MFSSLAALPLVVQLAIVIGGLIAAIVLGFLGKVGISTGKFKINFGKSSKAKKVRMCSDCRKLVMTKTMQFDHDVYFLRSDVLRDQMNYAEQKIHEVLYDLTASYRQDMVSCRDKDKPIDQVRENKEYLLYQEAIGNAMVVIKNEIRKSFKENGFIDMDEDDFKDYIKGKTKLLINMGREYVRSRYPFENMIVPIEWRFNRLPEKQIESVVADLFEKAKQIKQASDEKIESLGEKFDTDIEELRKAN